MTRDDILSFLDSYRKPEVSDPLHRWIGTYNNHRVHLIRFFRWLYYPSLEQKKRPKPACIENIPQLVRREKSIYKPTDLWTLGDNLLFLKYCPSKRDCCYHAISRDTSCRPHEILKLRIKDIVFKITGDNRQYAEVLVNGKMGSRHIPLINSIPYLKDWLDDHPQRGNPNASLICGIGKSLGRRILSSNSETVLGIFGFDRTLYGKLKDKRWWMELRRRNERRRSRSWCEMIDSTNSTSHPTSEIFAYHKRKRVFLNLTDMEKEDPDELQIC